MSMRSEYSANLALRETSQNVRLSVRKPAALVPNIQAKRMQRKESFLRRLFGV